MLHRLLIIVAVVIAGVIILLGPLSGRGVFSEVYPNLIRNESFERWDKGEPIHWTSTGKISRFNNDSLKLENNSAAVSQIVASLTPGATYKVSLKLRGGKSQVRFVYSYNVSSRSVATENFPAHSDWTKESYTFSLPAGLTGISGKINISSLGSADVWVDDVSMNQVGQVQLTHTVCKNNACAVVVGLGSNTCKTDADCLVTPPPEPDKHKACQNKACVLINGAGPDSCQADVDCAPPPITGTVKILCDGKSFSSWGDNAPIEIGNSPDDTNPEITKIIRRCTFTNPAGVAVQKPAIIIKEGKNILIEDSRFENIRTLTPDVGVFAIAMSGQKPVDNVTVRNNFFKDIGADGIQPGTGGSAVTNIRIENNEFVGSEEVGENAVDVKGAAGPIFIAGNKIHGFRPCQSSKTDPPGKQDCTGSFGPGIVIHVGSTNYPPTQVTIENNDIYDNVYGINVSGGKNIVVKNNRIHDNQKGGILYSGGDLTLSGNTYSGNPKDCSGISPCQ